MSSAPATDGFFRWDDLEQSQVEVLIVQMGDEQPGFADRVVERVGPAGADALDYSAASLRWAWRWFAANAVTAPIEEIGDPADLAIWMRANTGRVRLIGLDYAWMGTELAAYFSEVLRRNSKIRWGPAEGWDKRPALLGPNGFQLENFPMQFAVAFADEVLADVDHMVRQALVLGGGHGSLPEPMWATETFGDSVGVSFCEEIANEHLSTIEDAEQLLMGIDGLVMKDGDHEQMWVEHPTLSPIRLGTAVRQALRQLVDPRF